MRRGGDLRNIPTSTLDKESSRFAQVISLYPQRMLFRSSSAKATISSDKIKLKKKILTEQHRLLYNREINKNFKNLGTCSGARSAQNCSGNPSCYFLETLLKLAEKTMKFCIFKMTSREMF